MKKILIATAVAASFASVAHAQSSVTLYGTLDTSISYTSNVAGGKQFALSSGSTDENRFGLRGVEDLGGGLKTIFTLEEGFDTNNGAQAKDGKMFSRQSFVGIASQAGTVTLGRQYDAMQDFVSPLSATGSWGGSNFAHYGNLDHLDKNSEDAANNSIKYTSANYAGFSFGGTYSFSNSSQFANNRAYSFGAGYENAGLRVGAGYAQQNNPNVTSGGAYNNLDLNNIGMTGVSFRQRQFGAGATYAFGPALFGIVWTQARLDNVTGGTGSVHTNNYEANATYNLTPALGLGIAYTYSNGAAEDAHFHANQVGLKGDYSLSKRTDVYLQGTYQETSAPAGSTINAVIDNGSATGVSSSHRQGVASVGLRHRF